MNHHCPNKKNKTNNVVQGNEDAKDSRPFTIATCTRDVTAMYLKYKRVVYDTKQNEYNDKILGRFVNIYISVTWTPDLLTRVVLDVGISFRRQEILEYVIENNVDFDFEHKHNGYSPLQWAVHKCNRTAALYLMGKCSLESCKKNLLGFNKLQVAIVCSRGVDRVEQAIEQNDMLLTGWLRAKTCPPLHWAVLANRIKVAELLIKKYKVNVDEEDYNGNTAFKLAIDLGSLRMMRYLIEVGKSNWFDIRKECNLIGPLLKSKECVAWLLTRPESEFIIRDHLDASSAMETMTKDYTLDLRRSNIGYAAGVVIAKAIMTRKTINHIYRIDVRENPKIGINFLRTLLIAIRNTSWISDIYMDHLNVITYNKTLQWNRISKTQIRCPFPSLLDITSWGIANRITETKNVFLDQHKK